MADEKDKDSELKGYLKALLFVNLNDMGTVENIEKKFLYLGLERQDIADVLGKSYDAVVKAIQRAK